MNIADHAIGAAESPALIVADGGTISYGELYARSQRVAALLYEAGLRRGDGVALVLPNRPEFLEITWGCQLSGLYYSAVNTHFTPDEVAYVVDDSEAKAVFIDESMAELGGADPSRRTPASTSISASAARCPAGAPTTTRWRARVTRRRSPTVPRCSTRRAPPGGPRRFAGRCRPTARGHGRRRCWSTRWRQRYGMTASSVYLSPAPLYHAAGVNYTMAVHRVGAASILMRKFDAEAVLRLIETHRVTHAQFVPTMFVRMLKLPGRGPRVLRRVEPAVRDPRRRTVPGGRQAPDDGVVRPDHPRVLRRDRGIRGHDDRARRNGSPIPDRSASRSPRCTWSDEDGVEVPVGESGELFFEGGPAFEYFKDPEKTASVSNDRGWRSLGDMGYVDEDGYLYLTDRSTFMIVSGGVNIYPQEAENLLVMHPKLVDAAVFGVPNDEFGEEVKAVVQPAGESRQGPNSRPN